MAKDEYRASDIEVLTLVEAVRRRPAMYVGSVDANGIHELLTTLLDTLLDEAVEGHCSRLTITLAADRSITVEDDGRGIPVDLHEKSGQTLLELVFTTIAACYCGCTKRAGHRRSLYGFGVSLVNALSESLVVETTRDAVRYRMRFERGKVVGGLERVGAADGPGTRIRFLPDRSIFDPAADLDAERVREELHGLAALVPGLSLELVADGSSTALRCPDGLADLVRSMTEEPRLERSIVADASQPEEGEAAEARVAVQIDNTGGEPERLIGFVNSSRVDAGTHIEGLVDGLDLGFKDAASIVGLPEPARRPGGLVAAVSVDLPFPDFERAPRRRLTTASARDLVKAAARRSVAEWAATRPDEARAILG